MGIWGSYYNIPKATFCLLKGDYPGLGLRVWGWDFLPIMENPMEKIRP